MSLIGAICVPCFPFSDTKRLLKQGCTNLWRLVTRATNFYTVVLNICGSWVLNLVHVALLPPAILSWSLDFCGILCIPVLQHYFYECRIVRIKPCYGICINPEGCGFDSRWCHWNFSLT